MKKQDLPKLEPGNFPVGANFFQGMETRLSSKVGQLDNWRTSLARQPETVFPVQDGIWWEMEEGIRRKINGSEKPIQAAIQPKLIWVLASTLVLVVASVLWFANPFVKQAPDYEALLNQSNEPELVAYLADSEWPIWAEPLLGERDLMDISISVNEQEAETDLEENVEQWMN